MAFFLFYFRRQLSYNLSEGWGRLTTFPKNLDKERKIMLNEFGRELFQNLSSLVENNEAFYFQDFKLDDSVYRIYNYRLASYSDFMLPGALEARGIMFEMEGEEPLRLASMPMHKFFNLHENPLTSNVNLDSVESIEVKSDGSLISSFIHNGKLRLKSKGSLFSEQAVDALEWLKKNKELYDFVEGTTQYDITVNMEWVSPKNRIVLGYMEPKLIILNFRDLNDGSYIPVSSEFIKQNMSPDVDLGGKSYKEFVESIPQMTEDIEGFVVKTKSGLWFKVKTDKYVSLHHAKDSVTNPRRLFEVILDEGIDDLKSMFYEDKLLLKQIDEMEEKVSFIYNNIIQTVESFFSENKHLSRKDYALNGQQVLNKLYFSLAMNLYIGKENNYKEFMKKKYKEFGIVDSSINE